MVEVFGCVVVEVLDMFWLRFWMSGGRRVVDSENFRYDSRLARSVHLLVHNLKLQIG